MNYGTLTRPKTKRSSSPMPLKGCVTGAVLLSKAVNRPTYLFTNLPDLPTVESAEALLQFVELYRQHDGESIPGRQFPEALQSAQVAKIPAV
ncbi:DUF1636 family protein [Halomicronema hongdechloris]|uniref:DUF1636 family protein n=1 Tax=Halomicronema hongdechloris TaxID=1209493 RepID=UPI0009BBA4CA|nr:DUF1636 family protein [Halomicronema hongdechloris]